jgi:hypothetical protein
LSEFYSDTTQPAGWSRRVRWNPAAVYEPICGTCMSTITRATVAAEMHWGDLKEMRIAPLPTEIDLLETRPSSTYYGYEYDAQGNWTYRTKKSVDSTLESLIRGRCGER